MMYWRSMLDLYLQCFNCAKQSEYQQRIVDSGALPHLIELLKIRDNGVSSRAVSGVLRRAADAISHLVHENCAIKRRVRFVPLICKFICVSATNSPGIADFVVYVFFVCVELKVAFLLSLSFLTTQTQRCRELLRRPFGPSL